MTEETPDPADEERWALSLGGRTHEVTVVDLDVRRRLTWLVDGVEVASKETSDEKVILVAPAESEAGAAAVRLWLPMFVGPTRRVALFGPGPGKGARERAEADRGGVEFAPEPGSKAAKRQTWIRDHPTLYTLKQTLIAVAGVVIPLVLGSYVVRFALNLPWPDWLHLPDIPWPDISLPRIAWPDIPWPDIPWPDITLPAIPWPEWSLPPWVEWLLDNAKYLWPIVLALVMARAEVRRRRKAAEASRGDAPDGIAVQERPVDDSGEAARGGAADDAFGEAGVNESATGAGSTPTDTGSQSRSASPSRGGPTADDGEP